MSVRLSSLALYLLGSVCALVACAEDSPVGATTDELLDGQISSEIETKLERLAPSEKGRTWALTRNNSLPKDWVVQIPLASTWGSVTQAAPASCDGATCEPSFALRRCADAGDCDGDPCVALLATKTTPDATPTQVCAGHSDAILDQIYGLMTSATSTLDVSSLWTPTGRFLATMRNALSTLEASGARVRARFLFGTYPGYRPDTEDVLAELTRDLHRGSALEVTVALYNPALITWNHSKIIAVDGREALVGGMNLSQAHYLDSEPVHDVSLHVRGPAAAAAQTFLNALWESPCRTGASIADRTGRDRCPAPFEAPASVGSGNVRVLALGRTGRQMENPSDIALIALIDAARRSVQISQQDLGSMPIAVTEGALPKGVLDALIRKARRGVRVDIVVSNDGAHGGAGRTDADSYSNSWTNERVWKGMVERAKSLWGADIVRDLCNNVHLATVRASADATWPSGAPLANHAKVVIVDQQAAYVGSQNLYSADLAEFGFLIDDRAATQELVRSYYTPLADYSRVTTYQAPSCAR